MYTYSVTFLKFFLSSLFLRRGLGWSRGVEDSKPPKKNSLFFSRIFSRHNIKKHIELKGPRRGGGTLVEVRNTLYQLV